MPSLSWSYWISADRGALEPLPHGRGVQSRYVARFTLHPFSSFSLHPDAGVCFTPLTSSTPPLKTRDEKTGREEGKRERNQIQGYIVIVSPGAGASQGCPDQFGPPSGILQAQNGAE